MGPRKQWGAVQIFLIAMFLGLGAVLSIAQQTAEPSGSSPAMFSQDSALTGIAEAARTDIRRLIELMGVRQAVNEMFASFFDQIGRDFENGLQRSIPVAERRQEIAASIVQKLGARVKPEETVVDATLPFYEKNFSPEEIKGLIAFYESPLGNHFAEVHLQIMPETMARGQEWTQANFTPIFQEIMLEVVEENPELKPPQETEQPSQPQQP